MSVPMVEGRAICQACVVGNHEHCLALTGQGKCPCDDTGHPWRPRPQVVVEEPPRCPWSGLPVPECKRPQGLVNEALDTPLCDCFDFPEWDEQ